jgi:hypothetical protein
MVSPAVLPNCSLFYCYANQLTGSIPDLSANTALTQFYCYANQLTGSIPDLSANTALTQFYCYANQLTGSIPDLSANTALTQFYCNSNQLTGWDGGSVSATLGNYHAGSQNAPGSGLSSPDVDGMLAAFVAAGRNSGTRIINLSGGLNAAPSATGEGHIDTLRSRGWTVTVTGGY